MINLDKLNGNEKPLSITNLVKLYHNACLGSITYRQNPRGIDLDNLYRMMYSQNILYANDSKDNISFRENIKGIIAIKSLNDELRSIDVLTKKISYENMINLHIALNYKQIDFVENNKQYVPENHKVIPIFLEDISEKIFSQYDNFTLDRLQWKIDGNGKLNARLI